MSSSSRTQPARPVRPCSASEYDVADHLRTPQEMTAYLDAWLVDAPDDASGIARALSDIARALGLRQHARAR
jgi:DNA-binding phage protein